MANELVIHYPTGSTLYVLLFDATGQIYNGSTFGAPSSASWATYDIAMTEVPTATGIYRASMPAVAAGAYGWVVRKQAGGSPAVSDITVGAGSIRWTGTAEEAVPAAVNVILWAGDGVNDAIDGYVPVDPQDIADALLLAPVGVAADGSAMDYLADIVAAGGLDLDTVLETPVTLGEALRVMLAALAGKTDGSGTPALTFLGQDGATVRISATVDGIGNRTAVTVDGA